MISPSLLLYNWRSTKTKIIILRSTLSTWVTAGTMFQQIRKQIHIDTVITIELLEQPWHYRTASENQGMYVFGLPKTMNRNHSWMAIFWAWGLSNLNSLRRLTRLYEIVDNFCRTLPLSRSPCPEIKCSFSLAIVWPLINLMQCLVSVHVNRLISALSSNASSQNFYR